MLQQKEPQLHFPEVILEVSHTLNQNKIKIK